MNSSLGPTAGVAVIPRRKGEVTGSRAAAGVGAPSRISVLQQSRRDKKILPSAALINALGASAPMSPGGLVTQPPFKGRRPIYPPHRELDRSQGNVGPYRMTLIIGPVRLTLRLLLHVQGKM